MPRASTGGALAGDHVGELVAGQVPLVAHARGGDRVGEQPRRTRAPRRRGRPGRTQLGETAGGVPREPLVAHRDEAGDRRVGRAEGRGRCPSSPAWRNGAPERTDSSSGAAGSPSRRPGRGLEVGERRIDLGEQPVGHRTRMTERAAGLGRDDETRAGRAGRCGPSRRGSPPFPPSRSRWEASPSANGSTQRVVAAASAVIIILGSSVRVRRPRDGPLSRAAPRRTRRGPPRPEDAAEGPSDGVASDEPGEELTPAAGTQHDDRLAGEVRGRDDPRGIVDGARC